MIIIIKKKSKSIFNNLLIIDYEALLFCMKYKQHKKMSILEQWLFTIKLKTCIEM